MLSLKGTVSRGFRPFLVKGLKLTGKYSFAVCFVLGKILQILSKKMGVCVIVVDADLVSEYVLGKSLTLTDLKKLLSEKILGGLHIQSHY